MIKKNTNVNYSEVNSTYCIRVARPHQGMRNGLKTNNTQWLGDNATKTGPSWFCSISNASIIMPA